MAEGHSYSYVTPATLSGDTWARVQPLLESWKPVLQDLPGYAGSDVMARTTGNGALRMHVRVTWLTREQLEEFADCRWETERMIAATGAEPGDMRSETFEHFI